MATKRYGTRINRRVHSCLMVRMQRSITARLPYLPMAPNRWRMPRRRHQRLKSLAVNWLPWSETRLPGLMAPEEALQKPPNGQRGGLATEDGEAHEAPRAVVGGNREPP